MDTRVDSIVTAAQSLGSDYEAQGATLTQTIQDKKNIAGELETAQQTNSDLQRKLSDALAQIPAPVPTVPLISLTAHNASTSPKYNKATYPGMFTGITHHDASLAAIPIDSTIMDDSGNTAAPVNVSDVSLRTLMPATWDGRLMNWMQAWWRGPGSNHPDIGYSNTNPDDMARIKADSRRRGFDVNCFDWYTAADDAVVDLLADNSEQTFCLAIDQQALSSHFAASQYQTALGNIINHFAGKYFQHPRYELVGGRPLLLLWNMASVVGSNVDWMALKSQAAGSPLYIHYQATGFNVPGTDGAFFWLDPNAPKNSGVASGVTYLKNYALPAMAQHKDKICISSFWPGFNGTKTKSVKWSDGKFIDRQWGRTLLETIQASRDYVAAGGRVDLLLGVTWDDHEEGSTLQGGVLNDVAFSSVGIKGTVLSWAITGNENTVARYDVYALRDSSNVVKVASVPAGAAKQVDLAGAAMLGSGVFVQAVGQPCMVNRLSGRVPIAL